jgi:hypothetical protein
VHKVLPDHLLQRPCRVSKVYKGYKGISKVYRDHRVFRVQPMAQMVRKVLQGYKVFKESLCKGYKEYKVF